MTPRPAKPSRGLALAGLGGFLLGAATVLLVVWLYRDEVAGPPAPAEEVEVRPAPAPELPAPEPEPVPEPSGPAPSAQDLARRNLLVPVHGTRREDLRDTFSEARGERVHEAIDILAPRNTPVVAVEDGRIAKLFTSDQGGLTIYQFDPTETHAYYYAHLERYADRLQEGDQVRRGQVIGYVGVSGNAPKDTPHLHFAIFRLKPERRWWEGTPLNPFPLLLGTEGGDSRAAR